MPATNLHLFTPFWWNNFCLLSMLLDNVESLLYFWIWFFYSLSTPRCDCEDKIVTMQLHFFLVVVSCTQREKLWSSFEFRLKQIKFRLVSHTYDLIIESFSTPFHFSFQIVFNCHCHPSSYSNHIQNVHPLSLWSMKKTSVVAKYNESEWMRVKRVVCGDTRVALTCTSWGKRENRCRWLNDGFKST